MKKSQKQTSDFFNAFATSNNLNDLSLGSAWHEVWLAGDKGIL